MTIVFKYITQDCTFLLEMVLIWLHPDSQYRSLGKDTKARNGITTLQMLLPQHLFPISPIPTPSLHLGVRIVLGKIPWRRK